MPTMTAVRLAGVVALVLGAAVFVQPQEREGSNVSVPAPLADHHQQLFSPSSRR
jgi:hypothetical protein